MRKRLYESRYFRLQQEHTAKGRRFYRIVVWNLWPLNLEDVERIRDVMDPQRNKSGRNGTNWKYTNRQEAEQMYSMLLLRWA